MSNQTPAIDVLSMKLASGITDNNIGDAMEASAADTAGVAADGEMVIGKLVSRDKDGSEGGVQYRGVIRFSIGADLAASDLNKAIVGAGSGNVKAITENNAAMAANGRGAIIDYDNAANWVDVIFP